MASRSSIARLESEATAAARETHGTPMRESNRMITAEIAVTPMTVEMPFFPSCAEARPGA